MNQTLFSGKFRRFIYGDFMANTKAKDFAGKMTELEQLIIQLEAGDLSLEDSLQAFETGIRLIRDCQSRLQNAEQKVSKLMENNGQLVSVDVNPHSLTD